LAAAGRDLTIDELWNRIGDARDKLMAVSIIMRVSIFAT